MRAALALLGVALAAVPTVREVGGWWRVDRPGPLVAAVRAWDGADSPGDARAELAAVLAGWLLEERLQAPGAPVGVTWSVLASDRRLEVSFRGPAGSERAAVEWLEASLAGVSAPDDRVLALQARWLAWRATLAQDLGRVHERAVSQAWFPPGHRLRHATTSDDLASVVAEDAAERVQAWRKAGGWAVVVGPSPELAPLDPAGEGTAPEVGLTWRAESPLAGGWRVDRPGFSTARVTVLVPVPSDDLATARAAARLLAGDVTGRLTADLREEQGVTYDVSADVEAWPGGARLRVDLEVVPGRAGSAVAQVMEALDLLAVEAAAPGELEGVRARLAVDSARNRLSTAGLAAELATARRHGGDASCLLAADAARAAVWAGAVRELARQSWGPQARVWVATGEAALVDPALAEAGLAPTVTVHAITLAEAP